MSPREVGILLYPTHWGCTINQRGLSWTHIHIWQQLYGDQQPPGCNQVLVPSSQPPMLRAKEVPVVPTSAHEPRGKPIPRQGLTSASSAGC